MKQPKDLIKEQASFEKRYWLRISNTCNNKCLFCLDSAHKANENFIDFTLLTTKINSAYKKGYNRIILSGGEATIHPKFIELIKYCKDVGFKKIQTITNGRMFSYKPFAIQAVNAGLKEATFSIHGHNPLIHDYLTNATGSFNQAVKGIINLLQTNNCIINIDIVINKTNYKYITEIIKLFSKHGIFEYDLLNIMPFGRAFKNRNHLFFKHKDLSPFLKTIFSYSKRPEYFIWTNRLPPTYLENYEELIQDPHKLYDEISSREKMFKNYSKNKTLSCRHPERCPFCYIKDFCEKYTTFSNNLENKEKISKVITKDINKLKFIESINNNFILETDYTNINKLNKMMPQAKKIIINLNNESGFNINNFKKINNYKIKLTTISAVFFKKNKDSSVKWIIELNFNNNKIIVENLDIINKNNIIFIIPTYEILSITKKEHNNLLPTLKKIKSIPILNCAYCLNKNGICNYENYLNLDIINNKTPDPKQMLNEYISNDYYVKSLRCNKCKKNTDCKGMHINFIRTFGFKILKEVK